MAIGGQLVTQPPWFFLPLNPSPAVHVPLRMHFRSVLILCVGSSLGYDLILSLNALKLQ